MKLVFALFFLCFGALAEETLKLSKNWKIEVLVTSPSLKGLESLFGHSAILVIPPGKTIEEGIVWEFQANIQTADTNKWWDVAKGGLTGKFPFIVSQEPAPIFFSRHIVYEFRNVQRIIVPTTAQQSEKIVNLLETLEKDSSLLNKYFFRTENCMTALLRVLKLSGLPINLNQLLSVAKNVGMIPSQIPLIFRQLLISYMPPQTSLNLMIQVKNLEKKYGIALKSKIENQHYLDWDNSEKESFKKFNKHELALSAQSLSIYDGVRLPFLQKLIPHSQSQNVNFVEMKNFPDLFYQICDDSSCAQEIIELSHEMLNQEQFRSLKSILFNEYSRSKQLFMPEIKVLESPQAISWKKILNILLENRSRSTIY